MAFKLNKEPTAKEDIKKILMKLDLIYQEVMDMRKMWHAFNEKQKADGPF